MTNDVHRLVTETGFIEAFWQRLRELRSVDPMATQVEAYESLNDEYREVFGEDRFKSFDAFRKRRDRRPPQ